MLRTKLWLLIMVLYDSNTKKDICFAVFGAVALTSDWGNSKSCIISSDERLNWHHILFFQCSFKYPSPSHCLCNDKGLGTVYTAGDHGVADGLQLHSGSGESRGGETEGFFIHYKCHSKKLVDALKHWGEGPNTFTTCEYRDGLLEQKPAIDYNRIRFLKYAMKHLEKGYPELLQSITDIETSHKERCKEIEEIMISDLPITTAPSFQKIITNEIVSACPSLNKSTDTSLTENNIYLPVFVFRAMFNTIYSKESSIVLTEEPTDNKQTLLWYQNRVFMVRMHQNRLSKTVCLVQRCTRRHVSEASAGFTQRCTTWLF